MRASLVPRTIYRARDGRLVRVANEWEAEDCARADRWLEAGTIDWWGYGLKIPLRLWWPPLVPLVEDGLEVFRVEGESRPIRTRTGKQMLYITDVVIRPAGQRELEFREMKNKRRSGPEYEKWWLKRQILLAMGIEPIIIGRDGQPVEEEDVSHA